MPSQLGYKGFPAAVCTSPNEVVCHGIPGDVVLGEGDIVNVDVTRASLDGFHGDTSVTFVLGDIAPDRARVVDAARRGLEAGIATVRPGARLGDVGAGRGGGRPGPPAAPWCTSSGGHGIGPPHAHAAPRRPQGARPGTGLRLRPGMTFTIEPMITIGAPALHILDDGWTVVTEDGSPSAQFEHTILVTEQGGEILTAME